MKLVRDGYHLTVNYQFLASQAEGWVFESQLQQTNVVKTGIVTVPLLNTQQQV